MNSLWHWMKKRKKFHSKVLFTLVYFFVVMNQDWLLWKLMMRLMMMLIKDGFLSKQRFVDQIWHSAHTQLHVFLFLYISTNTHLFYWSYHLRWKPWSKPQWKKDIRNQAWIFTTDFYNKLSCSKYLSLTEEIPQRKYRIGFSRKI